MREVSSVKKETDLPNLRRKTIWETIW